jgi:hypothetical protein
VSAALRGGIAAVALVALATLPACKDEPAKRPSGERTAHVGPPFRVDTVPPATCGRAAAAPCAVELRLNALGGFHVNRDYPFKFVAEPSPGVAHEPDPGLAFVDDQTAAMTVRFRAAAGEGPVRVLGTLKLSVCSDEKCVIEDVPVSVDVPTS